MELTVVSADLIDHIVYNTKVEREMCGEQYRTYLYQTKKVHGIPLKTSFKPNTSEIQAKFRDDIERLYKRHMTEKQPLVAVNNNSLEPILQELGIPFLNLTSNFATGVPKLTELDAKYGNEDVCEIHSQRKYHFRCSQRKCLHMYVWLKETSLDD